jgi:hypothetical protein
MRRITLLAHLSVFDSCASAAAERAAASQTQIGETCLDVAAFCAA